MVDRLVIKEGMEERLAQSLETALKLSDGIVYVEKYRGWRKDDLFIKICLPGFRIYN